MTSRLPIPGQDAGEWGYLLNQFLSLQHFNAEATNPANGSHQVVTIQPGTTAPNSAPLTFMSGPLMSTPQAGALEFLTDRLYFTQTTSTIRKVLAAFDDSSGATGDTYYRDSSGNFVRLGIGTTGQVMVVASGLPSWAPATGLLLIATTLSALNATTGVLGQHATVTSDTTAANNGDYVWGSSTWVAQNAATASLTNKTLSTGSVIDANVTVTEVLKKVYPVGSIYTATVSTSPATLFGFGTWAAFASGRTLIGVGTSDQSFAAGSTGGESNHALSAGEMPSHNHGVTDPGHNHSQNPHVHEQQFLNGTGSQPIGTPNSVVYGNASSVGSTNVATGAATATNNASTTGISTQNAGGGGAHNNLQPYVVVYMWQRTA